MDIYYLERKHIRNLIHETNNKIMEDLMDEFIWIGARTGKVSRMLGNGTAEFDVTEGSYDLYKKWSPRDDELYLTIISYNNCEVGEIILEAYESYQDASNRFDELHTPKYNVKDIFMRQTKLVRKKDTNYESRN